MTKVRLFGSVVRKVCVITLCCIAALSATQTQAADRKPPKGEPCELIVADLSYLDTQPSFKGGDLRTFAQWVQDRTKYPASAVVKGMEGEARVSFVVNKEGEVVDVKVVKVFYEKFADAIVKTIKRSPKWTPGTMEGEPVCVLFVLGMYFHAAD